MDFYETHRGTLDKALATIRSRAYWSPYPESPRAYGEDAPALADISLDGARLFTAAPPVIGRRVSMRFLLRAQGIEVRAEARVVWRSEGFRGRGGVMGVQFLSISGADEIAAYVGEG